MSSHGKKCGCSIHIHKELSALDKMIGVVKKPKVSKISEFQKSFDKKPNDNPFIEHDRITKKKNKNKAQLRKLYKMWKKRFSERYNDAQGPTISLSFFQRKELTELERTQILNGLVLYEEYSDTLVSTFVPFMEEVYDRVLENTIEEFQMNIGNKVNKLSTDVIEEYRSVNKRISEGLWQKLDTQLRNTVTYGIEDGLSTRNIAKEIRKKFDFYTKYEAERIARTESIRATGRGALNAYKDLGIEKYEILPAVDACPICKELEESNPYDIDDNRARPPIHPNCRCSVIPVL